MNKYETVYIIKPEVNEDGIKAIVEKFKSIILTNGEIESIDEWGKRRMAYPIDDINEGYYVLMNYKAAHDIPKELDRVFNITEDILRHMIIRVEE